MSDLRRWPLLAAGLAVLGVDLALLSGGERALALALLLGVGSVMVGAGIANVLRHPPERDASDERDRFG